MNAKSWKEGDRELVLTRTYDAPAAALFKAWTDPELVKQWFTPKPWSTTRAEFDLRPGGASLVVMADPDGNEFPNPGQYLEVVENRKLVFTDAYLGDWKPSEKPFFTCVLTFEENADGTTTYTARARHWTVEDCQKHEEMGFHQGWAICAEQLAELVEKKG
jgi:uncharacterized protein YndB with AHSA1/START domain